MLTEYAMRCARLVTEVRYECDIGIVPPVEPARIRKSLLRLNTSGTTQEENDIMHRLAIGAAVLKGFHIYLGDAVCSDAVCHYIDETATERPVVNFLLTYGDITYTVPYRKLRKWDKFSIPGTSGLLYEVNEDGTATARETGTSIELDADDRVYQVFGM